MHFWIKHDHKLLINRTSHLTKLHNAAMMYLSSAVAWLRPFSVFRKYSIFICASAAHRKAQCLPWPRHSVKKQNESKMLPTKKLRSVEYLLPPFLFPLYCIPICVWSSTGCVLASEWRPTESGFVKKKIYFMAHPKRQRTFVVESATQMKWKGIH